MYYRAGISNRTVKGNPEEVFKYTKISKGSDKPFLPCCSNPSEHIYSLYNDVDK